MPIYQNPQLQALLNQNLESARGMFSGPLDAMLAQSMQGQEQLAQLIRQMGTINPSVASLVMASPQGQQAERTITGRPKVLPEAGTPDIGAQAQGLLDAFHGGLKTVMAQKEGPTPQIIAESARLWGNSVMSHPELASMDPEKLKTMTEHALDFLTTGNTDNISEIAPFLGKEESSDTYYKRAQKLQELDPSKYGAPTDKPATARTMISLMNEDNPEIKRLNVQLKQLEIDALTRKQEDLTTQELDKLWVAKESINKDIEATQQAYSTFVAQKPMQLMMAASNATDNSPAGLKAAQAPIIEQQKIQEETFKRRIKDLQSNYDRLEERRTRALTTQPTTVTSTKDVAPVDSDVEDELLKSRGAEWMKANYDWRPDTEKKIILERFRARTKQSESAAPAKP